MDLSLSVFHIFSDGAVDTRVYSIYGPEYRAPYKFSLLLLFLSIKQTIYITKSILLNENCEDVNEK